MVQDTFIDMAVTLGESFGLNRAVCQIYALLYLAGAPMSPAEIGRALEMSKGNVSLNMRTLEQWNAVTKVWRKGYARALYSANGDIEGIVFDRLKVGLGKRVKRLEAALREMRKSLKRHGRESGPSGAGDPLMKKIAAVEKLTGKVRLLVDNLDHLQALVK
jgi:DNA-binding transcriptional regulator GbsR (MarR family)